MIEVSQRTAASPEPDTASLLLLTDIRSTTHLRLLQGKQLVLAAQNIQELDDKQRYVLTIDGLAATDCGPETRVCNAVCSVNFSEF